MHPIEGKDDVFNRKVFYFLVTKRKNEGPGGYHKKNLTKIKEKDTYFHS